MNEQNLNVRKHKNLKNKKANIGSLFSFCIQKKKDYLNRLLHHNRSGAILIIIAVFLPLLLLGIRYSEDLLKLQDAIIKEINDETLRKKCAKEAALAVARSWNPGLTLGQQKDAVLKVADSVYNAHPCVKDGPLAYAVPGIKYEKKDSSILTLEPNLKIVKYTTKTKYLNNYVAKYTGGSGSIWNQEHIIWRTIDYGTAAEKRVSCFDEVDDELSLSGNFLLKHQDIYTNPHAVTTSETCTKSGSKYFPNDTNYSYGYADVAFKIPSKVNSYSFSYHPRQIIRMGNYSINSKSSGQYKVRSDPNDSTVKLSIENDCIKVVTDKQIGYATPAQCNVDIVLAIPVNGAACNANNRDNASNPSERTYSYFGEFNLPAKVSNIPIYQMGQACKNFVKEHFYHIRGVNMGLIPYSGKLSISPSRATSWTIAFPQFNSDNTNIQLMIGACLYGSSGVKNADLTQCYKTTAPVSGEHLPTSDTPYYWGGVLTGCPIMCRRGDLVTESKYGSNKYAKGILLSTTDPNDGDSYKYLRMNLNPCKVGCENILSMTCEKDCMHFLPNPYYMIEPTADMVKIYEMCNALCPINDPYNVSNFVFAALEWANNFLTQTWTNDPGISAINGSNDSATFSRPSKTASDRKKAVILLVNKPDWFEPGEMTYLGFNNDKSEVPTVISDKIDFSINYSNSSKTFLDGSSYNGTIQGQHKLLQCSKSSGDALIYQNGYYQAKNGTYRLKFPRKGLLRLTFSPSTLPVDSGITFYKDNIGDSYEVRQDSASGTAVGLGTELKFTGTKTFVFKGWSSAPLYSQSDGRTSSEGINFGHNLSVKKVRYALRDANITGCTLKNQMVRDYAGYYGNRNSTYKQLILSDNTATTGTASPRYVSPTVTGEATYALNSPEAKSIARFRDTCISLQSSFHFRGSYSRSFYDMNPVYSTPYPELVVDVYGIKPTFHVYILQENYGGCYYYTSSNTYAGLYSNGVSNDYWSNDTAYTAASAFSDRVRLKFSCSGAPSNYTGRLYQYYIHNSGLNKTLQSTTPITSNPITYNNLIQNKGIYLATYEGENWICFQGDGELSVTVKGAEPIPSQMTNSLKFTNVSGNTATYEVDETQEFFIEASQISNSKDGDNYYVEFQAVNLKLISAEITNRPYRALQASPISYTDYTVAGSSTRSGSLYWGTRSYQEQYEYKTTEKTETKIGNYTQQRSGNYLYGCTYGSNGFAAVGHNVALKSYNGTSWTSTSTSYDLYSVCSTGGKFLAVGKGGIMYDNTGGGWNNCGTSNLSSTTADAIVYGAGLFMVGRSSWMVRSASDNGWRWDKVNPWSGGNVAYAVAYGNSKFVAVGQGGYISCSSNSSGKSFSKCSSPTTAELRGIAYGNGYFVAVGTSGTIIKSSNGTSWEKVASPTDKRLWSVIYANGNFIAVGNSGTVLLGNNTGSSWRKTDSPCSDDIRGVAYGSGKLVFVTEHRGYIYTGEIISDGEKEVTKIGTRTITIDCLYSKSRNSIIYAKSSGNTRRTGNISYGSLTWDSPAYAYRYNLGKGETGRFAAIKSTGSSTVFDLIDFSVGVNGKRGSLKSLFGGSKDGLGFYVVNSNNSARITSVYKGDIQLVVAPSFLSSTYSGEIRMKYGSNTRSKTITGKTTIKINKKDLRYDNINNVYYMDFSITTLAILQAKLTTCDLLFSDIILPSYSTVIDFSQNSSSKPKYNSNFVIFGKNIGGAIQKQTTYDYTLDYWAANDTSRENNLYDMKPYSKNDSYLLVEDFSSSASCLDILYGINGTKASRQKTYLPGLNRLFFDADQSNPSLGFTSYGKYAFLIGGFTRPINAVLYNYKYGTSSMNTDSYIDPDNDFNNNILKEVTAAACTKLIQAGVRVYAVLYRPQSTYKSYSRNGTNKHTINSKTHDYATIVNCVKQSGGKVYESTTADFSRSDKSDESELNNILDKIAEDIKDWADYKEAENVYP